MKMLVIRSEIPAGAPRDGLARALENLLAQDDVIAARTETEGDREYQVVVRLIPSPAEAARAREIGVKALFEEQVRAEAQDPARMTAAAGLGRLSRKYESNGDPDAFWDDPVGGPSYGLYQLAAGRGSVAAFLGFLEGAWPDFAATLKAAGGDAGARAATPEFRAAWSGLARKPGFETAQHAFIKQTYYDAFAEKLRADLGLNIESRSLPVRNCVWSTAVQHGPGNSVFRNALGDAAASLPDRAIIADVYRERAKVETYFPSSSDKVKESLKKRFQSEMTDALAALDAAGGAGGAVA